VLANAEGSRTTPSIVGFARNDKVPVGSAAQRQAVTREMGTNWSIDVAGRKYTRRRSPPGC